MFLLLIQSWGFTQINKGIPKNSPSIFQWADSVRIERGWQNIADTTLGKATSGVAANGIGEANGGTVSLGDKDRAHFYFNTPINDLPGVDIAVFENGFSVGTGVFFFELAIVEVSQNGVDYFAFPAISNTDTSIQVNEFGELMQSDLRNLAGMHKTLTGTGFDLAEIGIDSVHYVRITDVVGSIDDQYATRDSRDGIINDPWPTAFPSSGFDLDAVGVVDETITSLEPNSRVNTITVYPNPSLVSGKIYFSERLHHVSIYDVIGIPIYKTETIISELDIDLPNGSYLLQGLTKDGIAIEQQLVVLP